MKNNPYTQLATEFDQWAKGDRTQSMANGHWDVTVQMLDSIDITHCKNMIDVGCGNGWLVREVLRRGVENGIGVDISPDMISVAKDSIEIADRETYMVANGEDIPLADDSVDCITNIESLYYYPKPQQALYEWARIAKPGARLAMMMDLYMESPATHNWIDALDVPVHLFSKSQLVEMLTKAGWSNIEIVQHHDRRPMKQREDFVVSTYWPSYEQYVSYRETGSLCITAVRQ